MGKRGWAGQVQVTYGGAFGISASSTYRKLLPSYLPDKGLALSNLGSSSRKYPILARDLKKERRVFLPLVVNLLGLHQPTVVSPTFRTPHTVHAMSIS